MKVTLSIDPRRVIDRVDDRLYSSFVEHMGRSVYHGIYEPGHPTADDKGFRRDVMDLVRPLRIPLIRYPGGNFVSAYDWQDGVGKDRKATLDPAWRQVEPNEIGTDEFHEWARRADAGVMMAVNLGTRDAAEAAHLLEYCNFPAGTKYADMRVKNGHQTPYDDRVWCLGNEMDGIWQVGHRDPDDYAQVARKTACLMRMLDPSLELVACGSAAYDMPTFGAWERAVLEQAYDQITYLSLHRYYTNYGRDTGEYLGCANEMDRFIDAVTAICDAVGGARRTSKKIHLSFDEWNVWPKVKSDNEEAPWTIGPRREEYLFTMEDALAFGTLLIALIRHCDRVKIACLAQLVNVCAPIMTENMGAAWAQTIYYPFLHASRMGRGIALDVKIDCPVYRAGMYGDTPYIASVAVMNEEAGEITVFAVNRSIEENASLSVPGLQGYKPVEQIEMTSPGLDDANTAASPLRVVPRSMPLTDGEITLKKASWNVLRYRKA